MIKIEGLWKSFGSTEVLRGLDLEIRDGETIVIIGRSGGGKSVLLKHLCGLLKPDKGKVLVDGVDIAPMDEQEITPIRKQFGFLFQSAALFDSMTLYDNVAFPLREERRPEAEIQKRVNEALCIVDLTQAQDKKPAELSGGMRKRAALARALALDPRVVFFDEPSAGLDPVTSRHLDRLILQIRATLGTTMVIVSHELASIYELADRVIMLDRDARAIIAEGRPRELAAGSPDPRVREFLTRDGEKA